MPRVTLLLIICLLTFGTRAQVKFEALDSLASVIRKNHNIVTGMQYANEEEAYELSFPQDNFNILANDHTAYHSVYKKKDGKELLYITENIDLANAEWIKPVDGKKGCIVAMFRLGFPNGYLKTQVMEDGNLVNTLSPDYLEFYAFSDAEKNKLKKLRTEQDGWAAMKIIVELCNQMKIENGVLSAEMAAIMNNRFDEMLNDDKEDIPRMERFVANFPKSLYAHLVQESIKRRKEYNTNVKPTVDFLRNTMIKYKYSYELSNFQKANPEAIRLLTLKSENDGITFYGQNVIKPVAGPYMMMQKGDKIISYTHCLVMVDKNDIQQAEDEFQSWVTKIKKEIPEGNYTIINMEGHQSIRVQRANSGSYVTVNYFHYNKATKHARVSLVCGYDEKK